ncbi:MAG: adenosylmethionine decarboxylase [Phycisphaerae bacterium]|nr:adenosylmethionine decarboxylase [Phycisphaerae bacterium]NIU58180.1 adenosylmethionine decarboxylase [Phycisphaerae bacterium]NIW94487.1 adenosylmethionine decarboxylase [Phycisphaerae bacterium]
MEKLYTPRQYHLYAELYGVKQELLNDRKLIKQTLTDAISKAKMHLVKFSDYHHQISKGNKTKHQGISAIAILEESHAAIYTWPEHEYCSIDILTCGDPQGPKTIKKYIESKLKPENVNVTFESKGA